MIIGLTYDLRSEYLAMGYTEQQTAEFDREDTVGAIETALTALGHKPLRIGNAWRLMERLVAGERWDMVFNIAEGLIGIGREAQVPAILDLYEIPYTFSDPLVMSLTLHKAMAKRVIRDCGVPTSEFVVVASADERPRIPFAPPYFIKPVAEGTGKGVSPASIIAEPDYLMPAAIRMMADFRQPVLVEPFLGGREFTVGIVGTGNDAEVLGTMEVELAETAEAKVYSYLNKEECEQRVTYRQVSGRQDPAVREAERISLSAWQALGCRDGGRVDIRCDDMERPFFMEVNPLAGLHPEHSDLPILCTQLEIDYTSLIRKILCSAEKRMAIATSMRRSCA